jgi:hypothetical protein
MSKYYRNLLAVAWGIERFQKGKLIDRSLEQAMEDIDTLVKESEELGNYFQSVNMVIDTDLRESEVLSLYGWYATRKRAREEKYRADLSEKLKRTIKKLVGLSYDELVPFQVLVSGDDTYVTLVWDILTNSEPTEEEKNQLMNIAGKKRLTIEESLLILKYSNWNRYHVRCT